MPDGKTVLFEARIGITAEDMAAVSSPVLTDAQELEQAVQNVIGHTGAEVTCVFEED